MADRGGGLFFDGQVAPILSRRCLGCHNRELDDGGLAFDDPATLFRPRKTGGPAIVPGQPARSALIQAVQHSGNVQMPPGMKLTPAEVAILTRWVKRGARWGTPLQP